MNQGVHPLLVGIFGVALGLTVSAVGFTDYDQLHAMLTLADLRMFLSFVGAVALSSGAFYLLRKARPLPRRMIHRGIIPGGVMFGVGWAIAGACPGVVLAQIGQGKAWALVSLAGLLLGTFAYQKIHQRWFSFDRGTCG